MSLVTITCDTEKGYSVLGQNRPWRVISAFFFKEKKKQNPQTLNSTCTTNLIYYFITHRVEKSALGNPLALISVFTKVLCAEWTPVFSLSFLSTSFLPGHHQQSVLLLCPGVTSHWRGSCRGVTANLPLPAVPCWR